MQINFTPTARMVHNSNSYVFLALLAHNLGEKKTFVYNCVLPDDRPVRLETCSSWCFKMLL